MIHLILSDRRILKIEGLDFRISPQPPTMTTAPPPDASIDGIPSPSPVSSIDSH